jgi:hypothetical protein
MGIFLFLLFLVNKISWFKPGYFSRGDKDSLATLSGPTSKTRFSFLFWGKIQQSCLLNPSIALLLRFNLIGTACRSPPDKNGHIIPNFRQKRTS